jgi:hypothetical protein
MITVELRTAERLLDVVEFPSLPTEGEPLAICSHGTEEVTLYRVTHLHRGVILGDFKRVPPVPSVHHWIVLLAPE